MLSDRMFNFAYWVAMPVMMIFSDDKRKWVRVAALAASIFPLFPLVMIGMCFWVAAACVFIYETI